MLTINDLTDIEAPINDGAERMVYLVRSKSDPRYLIHGMNGQVFVRADGDPWEHPAYKITRRANGKIDRESSTAWFDDARYPSTTSAAA